MGILEELWNSYRRERTKVAANIRIFMSAPGKNYERIMSDKKMADPLIVFMSKRPPKNVQVEVPEETSQALHTKSGLFMNRV